MYRPIRKATDEEQAQYLATEQPAYPLYGFVTVSGEDCPIEDLRGSWKSPDPIYEVMAPTGKHFALEGLHSLLCVSLEDALARLADESLALCDADCPNMRELRGFIADSVPKLKDTH